MEGYNYLHGARNNKPKWIIHKVSGLNCYIHVHL